MLEKAIEFAARAHAGQKDKAGEPYILHPLRVMLAQQTEASRICAVLHDVLEDSHVSSEDLRREGFSPEVLEALDTLTKRADEDYDSYISRLLTNGLACYVKLADLSDNMVLDRLSKVTKADRDRIKKYQSATKKIQTHLDGKNNGSKDDETAASDIKAMKGWQSIEEGFRSQLLDNVFCQSCGMTTIVDYTFHTIKYGIVLRGKCKKCGEKVARVVDV